MACEYFIGDKKYSEQEFKDFLLTEGLESFIKDNLIDLSKIKIKENAIQKPSTGKVLQRQQGEVGETRGERGRMEQGKQGEETAQKSTENGGGIGSKPPSETEVSAVSSLEPPFTLIKRELVKARERIGLNEWEKETITDAEAIRSAESKINEWKENGTYDKNINKIIEEANKGIISDLNNNILAQHIADLEISAKKMDRFSKEYDANRAELKIAIDAGDKLRSESGRILGRKLQVYGKEIESVQEVELQMMEDSNVDRLTDEQKIEAQKTFEEYQKVAENEAKLRLEAEAEIERLKAELELLKSKKQASQNGKKKTKEEYKKERSDIIQSIKDKWNKTSNNGTLTAVPIPYAQQLVAIAPDVAKLLNSYIHEFNDITLEKARELLKKDINEAGIDVKDEDVRDLIAGKYNEKKKQPKSELVTKRQYLIAEEKLLLEIEAYENGEIPKTENQKKAKNQKFKELKDKLKELKKGGLAKDIEEPKTNAERLEEEKEKVNERITKIKEEILNKERELKEKEKPLNEDLELTRLREVEKEITSLRDKYLPKPKDKFEVEKQRNGIKKSLYNSIIKLNEQINNGERTKVEPKNKFENDEYINKLREIKKEKEDLLESIDPKLSKAAKQQKASQPKTDQEKFETAIKTQIKNNRNEQARIEEKINKKDYSEDEPKTKILDNKLLQEKNPDLYNKYQQSVIDKENVKIELERKRIEERNNNLTKIDKFKNGASILETTLRGTVAGFDQSMAFVQLLGYTWRHPINSANFAKIAVKDLAQKRFFEKRMANLHNSYMYDVLEKSGFVIYEPRSTKSELRNEMFGGDKNLWNKEFKIGDKKYSIGQALERSTVGWINNARLDLAINGVEALYKQGKTFENNPKEFKALARAVNEWTAHGEPQKHIKAAGEILNPIIWSLKMFSSTFNVLGLGDLARPTELAKEIGRSVFKMNIKESGNAKGFYTSLTPNARKMMFKEIGGALLNMSAFVGVGVAVGAIKNIDMHPNSPTFGYITFNDEDETKMSMFGRFGSLVSGLFRVALGTQYLFDKQKEKNLGEGYGAKTGSDVAIGVGFRGKMTPVAGLTYDYFGNSKKNYYTDEKITPKYVAKSLVVPMALQNAYKEAVSNEPIIKKVAKSFVGTYGINLSDKNSMKEKKENQRLNRIEESKNKKNSNHIILKKP